MDNNTNIIIINMKYPATAMEITMKVRNEQDFIVRINRKELRTKSIECVKTRGCNTEKH